MKQVLFVFLAILVSFSTQSFGQTQEEMARSRKAEQDAVKAYRARLYPDLLAHMREADIARPNHSRLIYNLAAALTLNDQPLAALKSLERLADMGLYFDIAKNEDFKSLFANDHFKSVAARFDGNKKPVSNSLLAFSGGDHGLITDGVAYDPRTDKFYLGSVHKRKVVAVSKNEPTMDFSTESDGLWSVLGMRVDSERGRLWVCTAAFPQMRGFDARDKGRSGIFKYDLRSGKLLKKYILPEGDHALGDVVIARDGTIYSTDSISPVIYRIDAKRDEIEEFIRSDAFSSLQGLTFTDRERKLIVADYAKGIFRVDMATKNVVQLRPDPAITLLGIDGLYYYRGRLIAIQNGTNPNRVVSLTLKGDHIKAFKTLEVNHPDFLEPTLGALAGDIFYYIANSQWPLVNDKAELSDDKLRAPIVLKIDLKKALGR